MFLVQYLMPLLSVIFFYIRIYIELNNRPPSQHEANNKKRRRANLLILSIGVLFFFSWLPRNLLNVVLEVRPELVQKYFQGNTVLVYGITNLVGLSTALVNPILYGYLNESFRREYRELFRKLPWHPISEVSRPHHDARQIENNAAANVEVMIRNQRPFVAHSISRLGLNLTVLYRSLSSMLIGRFTSKRNIEGDVEDERVEVEMNIIRNENPVVGNDSERRPERLPWQRIHSSEPLSREPVPCTQQMITKFRIGIIRSYSFPLAGSKRIPTYV